MPNCPLSCSVGALAPTAPHRLILAVLLAVLAVPCGPAVRGQIVFQPPLVSNAGGLSTNVLLADLNEDGLPDAVTSFIFIFGAAPPAFAPGLGGGSFGAPQSLPMGGAGFSARRLADFDVDGHLDLLTVGGQTPPLNAAVLFGHGDGTFGAPVGINSNHQAPIGADVGDFDGDGAVDVAVFNDSFAFSAGAIVAILGNGDGTFDAPITVVPNFFDPFSATRLLRTGDTNGDGLDDIVYTASAGTVVKLSLGNGSFATAPCSGCTSIIERDFLLTDLNGDGRDDALTPLRSLLATPDGVFTGAQVFPSAFVPFAIGAGDLDADGILDAVIGRNGVAGEFNPAATAGDVLVLRGNGNGTFQTPGVVVSHVPQPRAVAVADVDADGRPDAVAACFQNAPADRRTLLNHTYAPGSPFLDLGGALAGSDGAPIQLAEGALLAGTPFTFRLLNGKPGGTASWVVGLAQLDAPFKGGIMIPSPELVLKPLPLDGAGAFTLAGTWLPGLSGLTLYLQFWLPQAGGPVSHSASNGVRAQVP